MTGPAATGLSAATGPGAVPRTALPGRLNWREAAFALGLAAILTLLLVLTTDLKTEGTALYRDPGWDRHLYRAMADGRQLDFGLAPFNRRILVPLLAGALPGGLQGGFFTVTVLAAIAAGSGMYTLARTAGVGPAFAVLGVLLLFSMGWGLKFAVADFWIPDATVLAFVVWAMVLARGRDLWVFTVVVAVGVLAKESVLFVLPLAYTLGARGPADGRRLKRSALAALPPLAVWGVLHAAIPARNGDLAYMATLPEIIRRFPDLYAHYDYRTLLHDIGYEQRWFARDWHTVRQYTVEPLGLPALALAAVSLRRHWRLALQLAPFVAAVYVQLLFATDTQRLISVAGPAFCLLAVLGANDLARAMTGAAAVAVAFGTAAMALTLVRPAAYTTPWPWQVVLLAIAALLAYLLSSHFRNKLVLSRPRRP